MSGYYFFLGYLPLPITPSSLSIQTPSLNKTVNLVNESEINIPKRGGLREISFDFLLPQIQKYPFAHYQIGKYTATLWIMYLKLWKEMLFPFQFIVTRMSPKGDILHFTNIKCVIEDFTFDEDADSLGFDTQCSIKLKEYREYGTKSISLKEAQEKYDKTYGNGHMISTQSNPKQASVKKARSSYRSIPSKTTIQKGETPATAIKRLTGVSPVASDIVDKAKDILTTNLITGSVSGATTPSDLGNSVSIMEPLDTGNVAVDLTGGTTSSGSGASGVGSILTMLGASAVMSMNSSLGFLNNAWEVLSEITGSTSSNGNTSILGGN